MEKVRYESDPYNRLVINSRREGSGLHKFRKVLDGQFRVGQKNSFSYHVKAPLSQNQTIPNQLKLKGKWSLTDNYDLCFTLDKQARETFGDQIVLQGEILDVNENSLLFAVTTRTEGRQITYVLDIAGSWKADEHNRLSFHVKKEDGAHDILTFNGAWEIDKDHQIIYQYEKASLIRKKRRAHTLTFKGYWDIRDKFRVSYVLSKGTGSVFDFQARAGIFKEDYIKYEFGIDLAGKARPIRQIVTLSGRWMLKKDAGLIFEIAYGNGEIHNITFGAEARLTGENTVMLKLKNDIENRELGISLNLSRKILKGDGEAFLSFLKSNRESAVYIGSAWRW